MRISDEKGRFLMQLQTKVQSLLRDFGIEATTSVLTEIAGIFDEMLEAKAKEINEKARASLRSKEGIINDERKKNSLLQQANDEQRNIITELRQNVGNLSEQLSEQKQRYEKLRLSRGAE